MDDLTTCVVDGCHQPIVGRGWCNTHYERWRRSGSVRADEPIARWTRTDGDCLVDGCGRPQKSRGWCSKHYLYWSRHGRTEPPTEQDRFWARVDVGHPLGCWMWSDVATYGQFKSGDKKTLTHRYAYELLVGPIPDGLHLDHLCRNPPCVNPDHLEPVTMRENLMRAHSPMKLNAAKAACLRGHPFDEKNTLIDRNGHRQCRTCRRLRQQARRAAMRSS